VDFRRNCNVPAIPFKADAGRDPDRPVRFVDIGTGCNAWFDGMVWSR
jgi:hypothetical protein